jgi:TDG/mug DNA glycosylase family protein
VRSNFFAVAETVTPNEIAKRLGVTGLAFRNWLRERKAEGHPLVASHEYRARYRFTRAEADQLAPEFAEQVLGAGATGVAASPPSTRTSRAGGRLERAQSEGATRADSRVEQPPSRDLGHRVTVEWMGEEVETLADLLREGLRAVAIGINPAPKSVAAGHYYQGNYGQTFFRRLHKAGLLPDGEGFEDDRSFAAGTGFTDVVKRPTPGKQGLRPGELEHGRKILEAKLTTLDVPLVIFVFKSAADTLLGRLPPHFYGLVPRRRLGEARVFVMPGPTAARANEADAIKKLRRALRAAT